MIKLHSARSAVVAIDMHRGHLDPTVATLPISKDRCPIVIRAPRICSTGAPDGRANHSRDRHLSR